MTTKKELIAQAESQNIFFRTSWKKGQIEAAIASGVKFGDLVTVTCKRSGLEFQVAIEDRKAEMLHPEVGYYTQHGDWDIRGTAVRVIESRKWDTWENLYAAIQLKLNPPAEPEPDWDFKGAWVARITGSHSHYKFSREYVDPVKKEGQFKYFNIDRSGDGIYEACYKSAKGSETRNYYKVDGGSSVEITLQEVEQIFPEDIVEGIPVDGCIFVKAFVGKQGEITEYEGQVVEVVRLDQYYTTVTDWDDFEDEYRTWQEPAWNSYIRIVEPSVAKTYLAQQQAEAERKQTIAQARSELKAIAKTVTVDNGAIRPESASFPSGPKFVIRKGYFQDNEVLIISADNKLWSLLYNGGDGDMWNLNNINKTHIGCYLIVPDEQAKKIRALIAITEEALSD